MLRKYAMVAVLLTPVLALASEGRVYLEPANNNLGNVQSLQRGAGYFVNYCMGCHSLNYVRFNRLARDLQLSEDQVISNLMYVVDKPFDTMKISMPQDDAARWFGIAPPDLSLMARAKGTDYIYNFLKTFYLDPTRKTGTNNYVLPGASMPDVLWDLQGLQEAIYETEVQRDGSVTKTLVGFESVTQGQLNKDEFDQFARDLANFLEYVSEPVKLERKKLGVRVLMFLLVFFLFALMLKKEYWKDVK